MRTTKHLAACIFFAFVVFGGVEAMAAVEVDTIVFNASSNSGADEAPGFSENFSFSSRVSGAETIEDAFGNTDGGVEATSFIFANGLTPDNGNGVMTNTEETISWITWETTEDVTLAGYQLQVSAPDRPTQLARFSVDGVIVDFFDIDAASGTINRYFSQVVGGSQFKLEVTSDGANGPRITEINAILSTDPVIVANIAPTSIANDQATLNATLWALQTNCTVYVHWDTTDRGTNFTWVNSAPVVGAWTNVTTNISHSITSLVGNTRYYYTFRATNAAGNAWGTPSYVHNAAVTDEAGHPLPVQVAS